ncbi:hypothetical protein Q3G72_005006 [Acer saccharum]|nr:hypothetical protein Q3G72_005006 [Acer saccharum]
MRATGVPGQHRGVGQSFSKGGSLNQGAVRKTLAGREGSREDKPVDGSWSQSDGEGVQRHSPILVDNVEVTTSLAGKLRDRGTLGAGEEFIPGQASPSVEAGLCPPLRLSEVVIESDFRFTSGERSSGSGVGLGIEEKRVDVTKKKGYGGY